MEEEIKFINGFTSWYETFYEIAAKVATIQNSGLEIFYSKLQDVIDVKGTGGVYSFVRNLTDKFELQYQGVEWDGNYFDTLDEFLDKELK